MLVMKHNTVAPGVPVAAWARATSCSWLCMPRVVHTTRLPECHHSLGTMTCKCCAGWAVCITCPRGRRRRRRRGRQQRAARVPHCHGAPGHGPGAREQSNLTVMHICGSAQASRASWDLGVWRRTGDVGEGSEERGQPLVNQVPGCMGDTAHVLSVTLACPWRRAFCCQYPPHAELGAGMLACTQVAPMVEGLARVMNPASDVLFLAKTQVGLHALACPLLTNWLALLWS